VPTFPLARWIVNNWWALFYEPCRADRPPAETDRWFPEQRRWIHRHCLRSAESGLFLPYIHFYSNGPATSICWFADDDHSYRSMPGYFLNDGLATIHTRDVITGMSEFVVRVLGWCEGLVDSRVDRLRADWNAITDADAEERAFCRAAGRMGLDPYCIETWDDGLVDLFSGVLGTRADEAIVDDLLESAEPASARELWAWVASTEASYGLKAGAVGEMSSADEVRTAKDQGYKAARKVRQIAGLNATSPIDDISSVARMVAGRPFSFEDHDNLPGRAVLAAVGWRDGKEAIIAGPRPARSDSSRFLESRGLYHALVGCRLGPRLVTRAHTWDQQAARAFAAEFLAPQSALCEHVTSDMDLDERRELLQELAVNFNVSTEVIGFQLRNAGVWRNIDD
jgi:Zn-dependent peptidase ImmA (M78 family)